MCLHRFDRTSDDDRMIVDAQIGSSHEIEYFRSIFELAWSQRNDATRKGGDQAAKLSTPGTGRKPRLNLAAPIKRPRRKAASWLGMTLEQLKNGYGHPHPDFQEEGAEAIGGTR